ncbi:MAG: multicopper oxidase domain-containing protein [Verrucomicrobia bacterium]|nr:multicopper oxidase domain-containing protein [Verrucomicrobiota bacterium]
MTTPIHHSNSPRKDIVKMKRSTKNTTLLMACILGFVAACSNARSAHAVHDVDGVTGPNFTFTAKSGYLSTAEGNSVYFWGFANASGLAQYPGPTMIVIQGQLVKVTLNNELPVPVSMIFPGQQGIRSQGGIQGTIARQAAPGGSVQYTFVATQPGTYIYESGSQPDLQTEMGLVGALIVRPTGYHPVTNRKAYAHSDSTYEHEFLYVLSEMDENIHDQVEEQVKTGKPIQVDMTKRWPVYWFINGRTGPDTVLPANAPWLPHQPYDALTMIHAGDVTLMRVVGAGRDSHPFHHHGNHAKVIARDGRYLSTAGQTGGTVGADLAYHVFTIPSSPGSTYDALFSWTGEKLGWDVYGHSPEDPLAPHEYAEDHGKPFPVKLPPDQDLTFGQMYSGSPFLGSLGTLPPGEGGFNPVGGFMYMWHSHAEKELCNNNIFGGGMMTFLLIAAHPTH